MESAAKPLNSILFSILLLFSSTSAWPATDYRVVTLQGGEYAAAVASNGLIAGSGGGFGNPFFWGATGERLYSEPQPFIYGYAYAINKNGVGLVNANENIDGYFLWNNGIYSPIPAAVNAPSRINDAGQIAAELANGHVGLWDQGVLTDLGTFPGGSASRIQAIGTSGQIVGSALTAAGARHAALWSNGAVTDLGTLPGDSESTAWNINDAGDVVGFSYSATQSRPFRWSNGVMTELAPAGIFNTPSGTLNTGVIPYGMNGRGQIIGVLNSASGRRPHVWDNGVLTDLTPMLAAINTAPEAPNNGCVVNDINDAGEIVGSCADPLKLGVPFKLTPVAPATNLAVAMSASPQPVTQGSTLTYHLTVHNIGSLPATGVNLTDGLPAGTSFVSAISSLGNCSGTAVVTCALGDLPSGSNATVQIAVIPNLAGTLSNTATVTGNEVETDTVNNSATTSVTVKVITADVGVTLTSSAATVRRNDNLTYTIKVNNSGPDSAGGVTLKDSLPSAMKFVSATSSQGTCSGITTVTCNLGTLASGANATVSIVVRAGSRGTHTNAVNVSSDATDSNTINNSASITTKVN